MLNKGMQQIPYCPAGIQYLSHGCMGRNTACYGWGSKALHKLAWKEFSSLPRKPNSDAPEQHVTGLFQHPSPEGGHDTAKDTGDTGWWRTSKRSDSIVCQAS